MKKWIVLFLFLKAPLLAEQTKLILNPTTGRLDLITQLSTTSIAAGTNVTVTTTSAGVTISFSGSAGGGSGSVRVEDGGVFVVNTTTMDFTGAQFTVSDSGGEALVALDASSVTLRGATIDLSTETDGAYVSSANATSPITITGNGSEGSTPTIALTQNAGTDVTADLEEEAHASEHQDGGADEISVTGLSGLLADRQKVAVSTGGVLVSVSTGINFAAGSNVTISGSDGSGTTTVTIAASASGGGGGYAMEPATVTLRPEKGFITSTGTFTNLSDGVMKIVATSSNVATSLVSLSTEVTGTIQAANFPALTGDLTGSEGSLSVAVNDDSHTHNGATLSGIDISDDTNLAVTAPITLSGDTVAIDKSSATLLGPSITLDELSGGTAGANAYDFGGASSLEMPNGASPTVDATGEFAIDTSSGQFVWYDGANAVVVPSTYSKSMSIQTPSAGNFPYFFKPHTDITILYAVCVSSANNVTLSISECNSNGTSCSLITTTTTVCGTTETFFSFTDTDIAARNRLRVKVEAHTTPLFSTIDLYYREKRQ